MDIPGRPSEFPISTVAQMIEVKSREHGGAVFLIQDANSSSFAETDKRSNQLATRMNDELGIGKGDVVGGLMGNSIRHVWTWFACLKLGAIWAPLDTHLAREDLERSIRQINVSAIFVEEGSFGGYDQVRDRFDHPEITFGGVDWAKTWSLAGEGRPDLPDASIRPRDPAGLVFTGGTTGAPKPILLPHFALVAGAYRYEDAFEPTPDDRHLTVLRLYHAGGQGFGVLGPLMSGISTVLAEGFDAATFIDLVNKHEATISDPTGGMWGKLVAEHDEPVDNTLRIVDGAIPAHHLARVQDLFGFDIVEPYGQTEAGGILCTHHLIRDASRVDTERGKPVGKANEWIDITIIDEEGEPVPEGTTGEICLRPCLPHTFMKGYYNSPEQTVQVWENLWLHTGDLGYLDKNGTLYYVGRKEHFLRKMGENISVAEVETTLIEAPGVESAAVVGVTDPARGDEAIKAYVVPNGPADPDAISEWCRDAIASYKCPRFIEFVEDLPRNETKNAVRRHALRERGIGDAWDRLDE